MPRANDNRKAVGTEYCSECQTLARFYQVQKGHRLGYLYRRCECGADQRTGASVQARWLASMNPTDEPRLPHPLDAQSRDDEPTEKTAQPQARQGESDKKSGLIGLGALVAAVAVALLT